ncbi:endonuclease/exonuclease/phosphatase family protein [Neolewinella litorea]|uniref:Endonuclease/exonuclease/phosphatase family protein n=1 Tax=Neolewinella litorea TaxID=2562452 RepID=A0A4S4NEH2_9BACT|nr:endonuclease/exonuclease/phosphatase family protein [Neolewinella litorea]THH37899.1 endonuclease/exonuclease/phosphatase family protein [Neolewinella litorea]
MTLATWNIDHPVYGTRRFRAVRDYLLALDCDVLILTEANAALELPGYTSVFSEVSPFVRHGRNYKTPNRYHQVAIYTRLAMHRVADVEDTNGVAAHLVEPRLLIYGSVMTIKDRWADWSDKRYTDRAREQCDVIRRLQRPRFLAAGDFNFRGHGTYNRVGALQVGALVADCGLCWPTQTEGRTVQHVLHGSDVRVSYEVVEAGKLSDHPILSTRLYP